MTIGDDFRVSSNGDIRHVSGTDTYTVLELHRWLQDLADDAAAAGDDTMDITQDTPSERSTDNIITLNSPYNIDDDAAKYFYDGSVTQEGGDDIYSGLEVVGSVNNNSTILQVVQNNSLYDGDSPFWGSGMNTNVGANILSRFLIKSRDGGTDVDGKRIRVYAREWGDSFSEFSLTLGLGNSTAAIFTNEDLNNATASGTISGYAGIGNTEGYQTIDLNNGNGARPYYSQWDKSSQSLNTLYERCKYITRRGTAETIHSMDGELFRGITHQWAYDNEASGPFTEDEVLSWGHDSTAGTAALLALKDDGATGTVWVQLLTGVVPSANAQFSGQTSVATADVNGSVTSRTVPSVFLGQSTGTNIIGAFGIGIEADDLTNNDKLTDLLNVLQQPPNNVTFTVQGLINGEDRVLVVNDSGSAIDTTQMTLNTALSAVDESVIDVGTGNIPADAPATNGILRVVQDNGRHKRVVYTSHDSDDEFTLSGSYAFNGASGASIGNGVYFGYIDKLAGSTSESFTVVYDSDRTLFVRVRDGGGTPIKTFETTATLGTAGGTTTAIRTSDS